METPTPTSEPKEIEQNGHYHHGWDTRRHMSGRAIGWVFDYSPYKNAELVIHLAIADVVNDVHENRFWMGYKALAAKANTSERTVRRTIDRMVADGYLELLSEGAPRTTATYQFLTPSDKLSHPEIVTNAPEVVTNCPPIVTNARTVPIYRTKETKENESPFVLLPESTPPTKAEPDPTSADHVDAVFNEWQQSTGKHRARLDPGRRRRIIKALKSYPLKDVLAAVRGWQYSPYHRGENPSNTRYNELDLLLRDAAHIEKFRDLALGDEQAAPHGVLGRNMQMLNELGGSK